MLEGLPKLRATKKKSLVRSKACVTETNQQLDAVKADCATLLANVALLQEEKQGIARKKRKLSDRYPGIARSTIESQADTMMSLHKQQKSSSSLTGVVSPLHFAH